MFISHKYKSIFIHIQKTGGDAIETAVRRDDSRSRGRFARQAPAPVRARGPGGVAPELWSGYFRFAFVRNPWERLVSWYSMCMQIPAPNAFEVRARAGADVHRLHHPGDYGNG
jgi:hypothetical protein